MHRYILASTQMHTFTHPHPPPHIHVNTHMHLYTHTCVYTNMHTHTLKRREKREGTRKPNLQKNEYVVYSSQISTKMCQSFLLFPPPSFSSFPYPPFFLSPLMEWQIRKSKTRLIHILNIESYSSIYFVDN